MLNKKSPYEGCCIEIHSLNTFPVVCLNRDNVNMPKTVRLGGKIRGRVSSQNRKLNVRRDMHNRGFVDGIRTKNLASLIVEACEAKGADPAAAKSCATGIEAQLTKEALFFISAAEVDAIAGWAAGYNFNLPFADSSKGNKGNKGTKGGKAASEGEEVETESASDEAESKTESKDVTKAKHELYALMMPGEGRGCSLDIALFGRMCATAQQLSIPAASYFAHAITTHAEESEMDTFTALDDLSSGHASAHMGVNAFNAGCFYGYSALNLEVLQSNLGGADIADACEQFLRSLYVSFSSSRQNSMSGACLWDYARILLRKGPRMQLSFDKPVKAANDGGWLNPSIEALNKGLARNEYLCGSMYGKILDVAFGTPEDGGESIDDVCANVRKALEALKAGKD